MMERNSFTEEELRIAKSVDLTAVASALGYTVRRIGNYHTLKEMDSIRIYNRRGWFRWSRRMDQGENGGTQIDFLRVFQGLEVKGAVFWLLDFSGYAGTGSGQMERRAILPKEERRQAVQKSFILPKANENNHRLYWYLGEKRKLSKKVIDYFIRQGLIYESKPYHNIVFKGRDKEGVTKFASMRGTHDKQGKGFQCDVAGNDKRYGFHIANQNSRKLYVFESAIDLMSYVDLNQVYDKHLLALGMVADNPLIQFLKDYPEIKTIYLGLDNDKAGREATEFLVKKYGALGYEIQELELPQEVKDWNEYLKVRKCPDFEGV